MKIVSYIFLSILLCTASFKVFADSVNVPVPKVKNVSNPYLLAQGTIMQSYGNVDKETTNKRCTKGAKPLLRTSIIQTEINSIAAVQGIQNTLQLRAADYHIVGNLYMSNQVVSNSYASANWQVWCQPVSA